MIDLLADPVDLRLDLANLGVEILNQSPVVLGSAERFLLKLRGFQLTRKPPHLAEFFFFASTSASRT